MSKRNTTILILVAAVIAIVIVMFVWVRQAPTETNPEGLSTELEEAGDPTMTAEPEGPPEPETSEVPSPAQ